MFIKFILICCTLCGSRIHKCLNLLYFHVDFHCSITDVKCILRQKYVLTPRNKNKQTNKLTLTQVHHFWNHMFNLDSFLDALFATILWVLTVSKIAATGFFSFNLVLRTHCLKVYLFFSAKLQSRRIGKKEKTRKNQHQEDKLEARKNAKCFF